MPILTVPRVLREKLGEDGAQALVDLINQTGSGTRDEVLTFVEESFERRLSEEVAKLGERITVESSKLNERIAGLDVRIADNQAALIRWMFVFWVGQLGAILGILFVFFGS